MLLALASLSPLLLAPAQEVRFEEELLATVPEDLQLEGKPRIGPDGQEWPDVAPVIWSPDGTRVGYSGISGSRRCAVIGNEKLGVFDFCDAPVFSSDGAHYVFRVGETKSKTREQWWTLLDGVKKNESDWIGSVSVTDEGELCYWEMPGAKIVQDGSYSRESMYFRTPFKKGKKWSDGRALRLPLVAEDNSWCATLAAGADHRWTVLLASKKGEKPMGEEAAWITDFAVSKDGKKVATLEAPAAAGMPAGVPPMPGMGEESGSLLRSGKKQYGKGYDNVGVPKFTPDGRHLAYKVDRDGKMGIAFDGDEKLEPEWDFVWSPTFSANSKRLAYVANRGGEISPYWRMSSEGDYLDAEGGENFVVSTDLRGKKAEQWGPFGVVTHLVLSEDGDRAAFAVEEEEGWRIHCGENQSELYDEIGALVFSEDGKRLAFGARSDRELWWRVLDLE